MKCPYCKAGIPVDGNKQIVRCPQCKCDVEVRKTRRMREPDEDEPFDLDLITQQINEMMLPQPQDEDEKR